jgi:hypothetical protein
VVQTNFLAGIKDKDSGILVHPGEWSNPVSRLVKYNQADGQIENASGKREGGRIPQYAEQHPVAKQMCPGPKPM